MELTAFELDFLRAAADLSRRQQELLPVLEQALGSDPYDFWMVEPFLARSDTWWQRVLARLRARFRREYGRTRDGLWRWNFHGLECDVENVIDGRFVRIDFGPMSRRLTFTGWGVLQYIMCTRAPWPTFDALARFLAQETPPWSSLSGDHAKMAPICDRLQELQLFVAADPALCETVARFTKMEASTGQRVIDIPAELAPPGPMDFAVCDRLVLAPTALRLLEAAAEPAAAPDGAPSVPAVGRAPRG
ncbi:hypothetical protein AB3662_34340 [Sorangium cellulosum]|uniref:DUF6896 domain-containing protein n=1 Tax=Sorangium cellulosum TaxID=56 RepID=UPI003D9A563E